MKADSENKSQAKTTQQELKGASCLNKLIPESAECGMAQILLAENRKLQDEVMKHLTRVNDLPGGIKCLL
ncbi:MAG: hypothetical protein V3R23_03485 [Nitrospinaceae bacterium]